MIYTERQFKYCIVLMKLFPSPEKKKQLKSNWQKIVVIRTQENGDGKRISSEDTNLTK